MATTYNNLYMDIRQTLRRAGIEAATLEARELMCFASGKTRSQLVRDGQLYVPPAIEERARDLVCRHLAGEPVAYLIGEWEFYGLPLDISESVLIPRPDTETLVDHVVAWLRPLPECRVLDLCAGSGCIGLAIASQVPGARVVLGELDEGALRICRQNIRRNSLSGQVVSLKMDALSDPPPRLGDFDCLVCNPPYIPSGDICTPGAAWPSRWASGRPTTSCGSCEARASVSWRSCRIRRASPAWLRACAIGGSMPTPDDRRNDFVNRWASAHLPRKFSLIQEEETWQRRKTAL